VKKATVIHIQWEGPFTLTEISKLDDLVRDYGVYQVYGHHPTYGPSSLLYIGQANQQTFYKRLSQENWQFEEQDCNFFVGRLSDTNQPSNDLWGKRIDLAERLLIYAHEPARNSKGLYSIPAEKLYNVHILNWGNFSSLLPEVSGLRYTNKFEDLPNYKVFEFKRE